MKSIKQTLLDWRPSLSDNTVLLFWIIGITVLLSALICVVMTGLQKLERANTPPMVHHYKGEYAYATHI